MKIWAQISIRKIGRQILGNHPFSRIVSFSSIQYSCVFYFVNFVIDIMFKNKYETNKILEKYLVKHPLSPTFASTLVNPVFLWDPCCSSFWFSVLCIFFVLLVLVLCIYLENILLRCSIVLLLLYILMIGLYIYTNNIQWYSHISQAC